MKGIIIAACMIASSQAFALDTDCYSSTIPDGSTYQDCTTDNWQSGTNEHCYSYYDGMETQTKCSTY
jgi:hypothetical protein